MELPLLLVKNCQTLSISYGSVLYVSCFDTKSKHILTCLLLPLIMAVEQN